MRASAAGWWYVLSNIHCTWHSNRCTDACIVCCCRQLRQLAKWSRRERRCGREADPPQQQRSRGRPAETVGGAHAAAAPVTSRCTFLVATLVCDCPTRIVSIVATHTSQFACSQPGLITHHKEAAFPVAECWLVWKFQQRYVVQLSRVSADISGILAVTQTLKEVSYSCAGAGTRPPLPPRSSPSQPTANGTAAGAGDTQPQQQQGRGAGDGAGATAAPPAANGGGGSGVLPQTMDISQLMSLLSGGGPAAAGGAGTAGSQSQAVTTTAAVGTAQLSVCYCGAN